MGKELSTDVVEKDYWRNNDQFADLFNAVLFKGENVIKADSLEELDTEESSVIENKKYAQSLKESRDILKVSKQLVDSSLQLSILGIENQELVHYAMPMRVMLYDGLAYKKQFDNNAMKYSDDEKRKKYNLTSDEFISRMRKEDKFAPVITIVIYYGNKTWDGAKRLHEMLEIPPRLLPFVNDYGLNLVEARNNKLIFHNKNNGDLFELMKALLSESLSPKEIRRQVEAYCKEKNVDRSVIRMVSAVLNAKINYGEIKEDGDMCTVFEAIRTEGKLEGRLEGKAEEIIEMGKEFNLSDEDILVRLQKKLEISLEKAQEYLQQFSKS